MRARRPVENLVEPYEETVSADDTNCNNRPDTKGKHEECRQLAEPTFAEVDQSMRNDLFFHIILPDMQPQASTTYLARKDTIAEIVRSGAPKPTSTSCHWQENYLSMTASCSQARDLSPNGVNPFS